MRNPEEILKVYKDINEDIDKQIRQFRTKSTLGGDAQLVIPVPIIERGNATIHVVVCENSNLMIFGLEYNDFIIHTLTDVNTKSGLDRILLFLGEYVELVKKHKSEVHSFLEQGFTTTRDIGNTHFGMFKFEKEFTKNKLERLKRQSDEE